MRVCSTAALPARHWGSPGPSLLRRGVGSGVASPLAPGSMCHTLSCPTDQTALPPPPSISGSLHRLTTVHYAQPIIAALSLPVLLDSSKNIGLAGAAPCRGSGKAAGAGAGRGMHPAGGDERGGAPDSHLAAAPANEGLGFLPASAGLCSCRGLSRSLGTAGSGGTSRAKPVRAVPRRDAPRSRVLGHHPTP